MTDLSLLSSDEIYKIYQRKLSEEAGKVMSAFQSPPASESNNAKCSLQNANRDNDREAFLKTPVETGLGEQSEAWRYRHIHHAVMQMGGWANFKHWVTIHAKNYFETCEKLQAEIDELKAARAAQSLTDAQAMDRAQAVEKAYFDGVRQGEINAISAEGNVVSVKRETWERIKSEVIEIAQHTEEPGTSAISQDLYDLIKSAEGDVSKNRQNLNISERHNEKSDDSQYVSVPKDALNELIRLVKYEAVVALEQSRMSVSLVEDIRNAIKAAEGES